MAVKKSSSAESAKRFLDSYSKNPESHVSKRWSRKPSSEMTELRILVLECIPFDKKISLGTLLANAGSEYGFLEAEKLKNILYWLEKREFIQQDSAGWQRVPREERKSRLHLT